MSEVYLSYGGYTGSVEVSLEDDCLFGKLLQIRDLVTYEADTVSGLKEPDRPDPGRPLAVTPP